MKKWLSALLCIVLCFGLVVPAMATNSLGVTFTAVLDQKTLNVSDSEQSVSLKISGTPVFDADAFEYEVEYPDGWTVESIVSSDVTIKAGDYNKTYADHTLKLLWNSDDAENVTGISDLGTITFTVPANAAAGDYTFTVSNFNVTKDYGTKWEKGSTMTATLTIKGAETYTVKFDANGGTGTMADVTGVSGSYKLPACKFTAPEGKQFKAWSVDGKEYAAGKTITVSKNITAKAVWEDIPTVTFTVSFDANGGTGSMEAVEVEEGSKYTLPECGFTAPDGKEFDKWDAGTPGTEIDVTADMTVKAQWKDKAVTTYTVKFDANGGTGSMDSVKVKAGEKLTLPECEFTAPEGQQFKAWGIGSKEYAVGQKITVNKDLTVKAIWEDISVVFVVSFDANGGSGTMADVEVKEGEDFTLPENEFTAPKGQQFKAWDHDGTEYKPGEAYIIDADTTFLALWEDAPALATVRFHLNGGKATGITDGKEVTYYAEDAGKALPRATKSGHSFNGWYDAEKGGKKYTKVSADLPADLYAQWSEYVPYDPGTPDTPKEDTEPEVKGSTITVKPEVKNGEADSEVSAKSVKEALKNTPKGGTVTVVVSTKGADDVELALSPDAVSAMANSDVNLRVETENGTVKLDADTVSDLAVTGKAVTVNVKENTDGTTIFDVTAGGRSVNGNIKIEMPATGNGQVLVIVKPDGTQEIVKKSVVENGKVYAEIPAGAKVKTIHNEKSFPDVANNAWHKSAVDFASSHELFQGTDKGFEPNSPMTRAMLATVLYRLEGAIATGGNSFADVPSGMWYTDAVTWASANGIVTGTDKGFEPNVNITREQIATMLYCYAKLLGLDTSGRSGLNGFSDGSKTSSWANEAMQWAVSVGLFKGDDNGALNPQGDATRAEVATILMRLVGLIVK